MLRTSPISEMKRLTKSPGMSKKCNLIMNGACRVKHVQRVINYTVKIGEKAGHNHSRNINKE